MKTMMRQIEAWATAPGWNNARRWFKSGKLEVYLRCAERFVEMDALQRISQSAEPFKLPIGPFRTLEVANVQIAGYNDFISNLELMGRFLTAVEAVNPRDMIYLEGVDRRLKIPLVRRGYLWTEYHPNVPTLHFYKLNPLVDRTGAVGAQVKLFELADAKASIRTR